MKKSKTGQGNKKSLYHNIMDKIKDIVIEVARNSFIITLFLVILN